jgi:hypothetical protein
LTRRTATARPRAVCCLSMAMDTRGRSEQRTPADVERGRGWSFGWFGLEARKATNASR